MKDSIEHRQNREETVTNHMITWSQIESECGDYRAGFVATFRKYEGQATDEKDEQGRTVKVTIASFARHVGIPERTFYHWTSDATRAVQPETRDQWNAGEARKRARALPPESKAELARELLNEPEVAEQVVHDPVTRTIVRRTLDQHYEQAPKPYPVQPQVPADEPMRLIHEFRALHTTMDRIVRLVVGGTAVVNNTERDALLAEVRWLRNALDLTESGLNAGSLDEALAVLLETDV